MKGHTGVVVTMGKRAIIGSSTNQKVNLRSSTESELIRVDDKITKILWTKRFLEWQEFMVKLNIIYQDNTSTIKLEENGKESSGKRKRHFDNEKGVTRRPNPTRRLMQLVGWRHRRA
jgi:hypothetical protein